MEIDLNCDLGEGAGNDAALMPLITSANIACGFHAGSPAEMFETIKLAKSFGVVIGAHSGHADREHFGRRELPVPPAQVFAETAYQIGAIQALAQTQQVSVKYIKPHGGLYHQANHDPAYAEVIVDAAREFNLIVMGLPHSHLEQRAKGRCEFVAEGFADRRYQSDGKLVPRSQPNAFIHDPSEAVQQVERLIGQGIRTICVHGDNPDAVQFVQSLRAAIIQNRVVIRAFA